VRFGNPLSTLNIATPGVLLGTITGTGALGTLSATFGLPTATRALAVYPILNVTGMTLQCLGATTGIVYYGTASGGQLFQGLAGEAQFRVEPSADPQVTVTVRLEGGGIFPALPVLDVFALTDPGAVGVFAVTGMPPINAVPPLTTVASLLNPGVGTTAIVPAVTSRVRVWDTYVEGIAAAAGGNVQLVGSVSGLLLAILRLPGVANDEDRVHGVGGGVILPSGDGVNMVVNGVGFTANATVTYDRPN